MFERKRKKKDDVAVALRSRIVRNQSRQQENGPNNAATPANGISFHSSVAANRPRPPTEKLQCQAVPTRPCCAPTDLFVFNGSYMTRKVCIASQFLKNQQKLKSENERLNFAMKQRPNLSSRTRAEEHLFSASGRGSR